MFLIGIAAIVPQQKNAAPCRMWAKDMLCPPSPHPMFLFPKPGSSAPNRSGVAQLYVQRTTTR